MSTISAYETEKTSDRTEIYFQCRIVCTLNVGDDSVLTSGPIDRRRSLQPAKVTLPLIGVASAGNSGMSAKESRSCE